MKVKYENMGRNCKQKNRVIEIREKETETNRDRKRLKVGVSESQIEREIKREQKK